MRVSTFVAPLFAAVALAQSSTEDPHPQTTFLTQTNSQGVVTGQPNPASDIPNQPAPSTEQPAVVTSQPLPASIPAVGPGVHTVVIPVSGNATTIVTVSANNSTTVYLTPTRTPSAPASGSGAATGTGRPQGSGTATGSATTSRSSGAAATMRAMAGSVVGVGAFVAAFL